MGLTVLCALISAYNTANGPRAAKGADVPYCVCGAIWTAIRAAIVPPMMPWAMNCVTYALLYVQQM